MVVFYTAFLFAYLIYITIRSMFFKSKRELVLNVSATLMYLPLFGRILNWW